MIIHSIRNSLSKYAFLIPSAKEKEHLLHTTLRLGTFGILAYFATEREHLLFSVLTSITINCYTSQLQNSDKISKSVKNFIDYMTGSFAYAASYTCFTHLCTYTLLMPKHLYLPLIIGFIPMLLIGLTNNLVEYICPAKKRNNLPISANQRNPYIILPIEIQTFFTQGLKIVMADTELQNYVFQKIKLMTPSFQLIDFFYQNQNVIKDNSLFLSYVPHNVNLTIGNLQILNLFTQSLNLSNENFQSLFKDIRGDKMCINILSYLISTSFKYEPYKNYKTLDLYSSILQRSAASFCSTLAGDLTLDYTKHLPSHYKFLAYSFAYGFGNQLYNAPIDNIETTVTYSKKAYQFLANKSGDAYNYIVNICYKIDNQPKRSHVDTLNAENSVAGELIGISELNNTSQASNIKPTLRFMPFALNLYNIALK